MFVERALNNRKYDFERWLSQEMRWRVDCGKLNIFSEILYST